MPKLYSIIEIMADKLGFQMDGAGGYRLTVGNVQTRVTPDARGYALSVCSPVDADQWLTLRAGMGLSHDLAIAYCYAVEQNAAHGRHAIDNYFTALEAVDPATDTLARFRTEAAQILGPEVAELIMLWEPLC